MTPRSGAFPDFKAKPVVSVRFLHKHTIDGNADCLGCGTIATPATKQTFLEAYDRVKWKYPFLSDAVADETLSGAVKPYYLLTLDTEWAQFDDFGAMVTTFTGFLYPNFSKGEIIIKARLDARVSDGTYVPVSSHNVKRTEKNAVQLFLIFYAPFANSYSDQNALSDEAFIDALNQISNDFKDYLEKNPPPPASVAPVTQ